jgi:hypothetical protein
LPEIFLSAPFANTHTTCVLPTLCEPLFHTYTKQDIKLQTSEQLKFLDNMQRFLKEKGFWAE